MSHTNETPNYGLPQYAGTDILNPLVDTNEAYSKIDTALKNIADAEAAGAADIASLEATVGDANSGLVKDVADVKAFVGDTPLATTAQSVSGAVNEVLNDVDTVANRVTVVENALPAKADTTDVVALGTRMTTAEVKITALEGTVGDANSGLVKDVNDLKLGTSRLAGKKIAIFGDSLSIPTGTWAESFATKLTAMGSTVVNRAIGGYKVADVNTAVSAESDTDYDTVILFVGTNDCMDRLTTFKTAVATLANNVRTKFANAEIFWITPPFATVRSVNNFDGDPDGVVLTQNVLSAVIMYQSMTYGINPINGMLIPSIAPNGTHLIDGIHFNPNYSDYLAQWVLSKIEKYVVDMNINTAYYQNFDNDVEVWDSVDADTGVGNKLTTTNSINACVVNGGVYLKFNVITPAVIPDKGFCFKIPEIMHDLLNSGYTVTPSIEISSWDSTNSVAKIYRAFYHDVMSSGYGFKLYLDTNDIPSSATSVNIRLTFYLPDALTGDILH